MKRIFIIILAFFTVFATAPYGLIQVVPAIEVLATSEVRPATTETVAAARPVSVDHATAIPMPDRLPQLRVVGGVTTISAGVSQTVGLRSDGRVVAVGDNSEGQLNVAGWSDIVAVSAGGLITVGLRSDGRVVATPIIGQHADVQGWFDFSGWQEIVSIAAGTFHVVGLRLDGTVVGAGVDNSGKTEVAGWHDITAVSAGTWHTVGLKADGRVTAAGENSNGQLEVFDWQDIVAVSAGDWHTVGLRSDGSVVATRITDHELDFGQSDVSSWQDIVAISAGQKHTVGLRADGTVVATRITDHSFNSGQSDLSGWRDIVAVSAGSVHTVGLRSNGTAVSAGSNSLGSINVLSWRDIKIPAPPPDGRELIRGSWQHSDPDSVWQNVVIHIGKNSEERTLLSIAGMPISVERVGDVNWISIAGSLRSLHMLRDDSPLAAGEVWMWSEVHAHISPANPNVIGLITHVHRADGSVRVLPNDAQRWVRVEAGSDAHAPKT